MLISCNLDDMTPEAIGYVTELLFKNNVLDVYTSPIMMKKSRPATLLSCLCNKSKEEDISCLLLKHTTTKGVRITDFRRKTLDSNFIPIQTKYGEIQIKVYEGYHIKKYKPEYENIVSLSNKHNIPFQQIYDEAITIFKEKYLT